MLRALKIKLSNMTLTILLLIKNGNSSLTIPFGEKELNLLLASSPSNQTPLMAVRETKQVHNHVVKKKKDFSRASLYLAPAALFEMSTKSRMSPGDYP